LPNLVSYLTTDEAASLDALVVRLEARTGIQIVPAVVGKADNYAEVPWKAFAIGAAFTAFGLGVSNYFNPAWVTAWSAVMDAVVILAVAGACTLVAGFVPAVARLLVRDMHEVLEVRRYAESLFLRRGLFATRARTGVLVLVSLFERRIEIVADSGFDGRVTPAEWHGVIGRMAPHLGGGRAFDALRDALGAIEDLLAAKGFRGTGGPDELPNATVQERGV
jgi:putative membrane protein